MRFVDVLRFSRVFRAPSGVSALSGVRTIPGFSAPQARSNPPIRSILVLAAFLTALLLAPASPVRADNGDCGIPISSGDAPKTSDCLFILRVGVGIGQCELCVCDTNDSGSVGATDALLCLKAAVGQIVTIDCPACTVGSGGCPATVEWTTHSGDGPACSGNTDCAAGTCSGGLCRTSTQLDLGWTGLAHHTDLDDGSTLRLQVDCDGTGGNCGECAVVGIEPAADSCRCANDPRASCDNPFGIDTDDCPACFAGAFVGEACGSNTDCEAGTCSRRCSNDASIVCTKGGDCSGGSCVATSKCSNGRSCNVNADCSGTCTTASQCQCFDGPPLPLSPGGVPFCLLSTFAGEVTGTVNVDTGASTIHRDMRILAYGGTDRLRPCPVCGGRCSNDSNVLCTSDSACGNGNSCGFDAAPADGVRGGACVGSGVNGLSCDVAATNASLPAFPGGAGGAGGAGYSLDCSPAKASLSSFFDVDLVESTGTQALAADLPCDGDAGLDCPCRVCSNNASVACDSDADCGEGFCTGSVPLSPTQPNACTGGACSATGDGNGACTTGPDDKFCDNVVKASGEGILPCSDNADCAVGVAGVDAGNCVLVQRRACFLDPIVAQGAQHPQKPVSAANFCVASVGSAGRNATFGAPGPGRLRRQSTLRSYCATDPGERYLPGTGGCPL